MRTRELVHVVVLESGILETLSTYKADIQGVKSAEEEFRSAMASVTGRMSDEEIEECVKARYGTCGRYDFYIQFNEVED